METAQSLLGRSCDVSDYRLWGPAHTSLDYNGPKPGNHWEANRLELIADIPEDAHPGNNRFQSHYWISDNKTLLWVESQGGVIVHTWVVPLRKAP